MVPLRGCSRSNGRCPILSDIYAYTMQLSGNNTSTKYFARKAISTGWSFPFLKFCWIIFYIFKSPKSLPLCSSSMLLLTIRVKQFLKSTKLTTRKIFQLGYLSFAAPLKSDYSSSLKNLCI